MNQTPHGIIVPLVTPFDAQQNVDETALRRIINHVIEGGVHGVFVAGTTSEFYALSPEEHSELFQIAVDEVHGRVPVYAGATGVTTRDAVRLTELAEQAEYATAVTTSAFYEGRIEKSGYKKLLEMMDITERTVKKAFRKNNTGRPEECER